jgi:signal transduction histidine kinase
LITFIHDNGDIVIPTNETISVSQYESIKETRYFIVKSYTISKADEIEVSNTSLTTKRANAYANRVLNQKFLNRGYIDGFRYRKFEIIENETKIGHVIIFVDCNRQIFNMRFMMISAMIISLLSLLTIFSLLRLFANKILKPIIDAHEKQKKFITNASHELKTPLTVITANSELLEMEYGENEYTQTINKQVAKKESGEYTTLPIKHPSIAIIK